MHGYAIISRGWRNEQEWAKKKPSDNEKCELIIINRRDFEVKSLHFKCCVYCSVQVLYCICILQT